MRGARHEGPLHMRPGKKVPKSRCPYCGYKVDRASALDEKNGKAIKPTPNHSISMCLECAGVSVYGDKLKLRPITAEELTSLPLKTLRILHTARDAIEFVQFKRRSKEKGNGSNN